MDKLNENSFDISGGNSELVREHDVGCESVFYTIMYQKYNTFLVTYF